MRWHIFSCQYWGHRKQERVWEKKHQKEQWLTLSKWRAHYSETKVKRAVKGRWRITERDNREENQWWRWSQNEKKVIHSRLCVSSLRRGHANLLCIVPIFADDPRLPSGSDHLHSPISYFKGNRKACYYGTGHFFHSPRHSGNQSRAQESIRKKVQSLRGQLPLRMTVSAQQKKTNDEHPPQWTDAREQGAGYQYARHLSDQCRKGKEKKKK